MLFERLPIPRPEYTPNCFRSSSQVFPKKPLASEDRTRRARPRDVFQTSLGRSAAQLYSVLCDAVDCAGPYTALAWPKIATLAKRMKVAERTVQRALRELSDSGWVGTPFGDTGGPQDGAVYHLHPTGKHCLFCQAAARTLNQRGRPTSSRITGDILAPTGDTMSPVLSPVTSPELTPQPATTGDILAATGDIFDSAYKEKNPLLDSLQSSSTAPPVPLVHSAEPSLEEFDRLMEGEFQLDQGAERRLWRDSRSIVPDATPEEIHYFFRLRAHQVYGNRRINNPTGLMLSTVSDWFVERRVLERRERTRREERENAAIQRQIAEFRKLEPSRCSMGDPSSRQPVDTNAFFDFSARIRDLAARKSLQ